MLQRQAANSYDGDKRPARATIAKLLSAEQMIGGNMSKYIDIAKQFVQEKLSERDDIVGVLLVGSAARGEKRHFQI
jgi:hypothetical protein